MAWHWTDNKPLPEPMFTNYTMPYRIFLSHNDLIYTMTRGDLDIFSFVYVFCSVVYRPLLHPI